MLVYGHPRCSTVKKALKYLNELGLEYEYHDLTEVAPTKEDFKKYHELSGLDIKKFFNTSGMQYRELNIKDKLKEMSLDECYALLSSNGMLVKRPLVICNNIILLGFKEEQYDDLKYYLYQRKH